MINNCMAHINDNYPRHLGEKYKNTPYVVLDIPRIVPDEHFVDMFNERSRNVLRLKKTNGYPFDREQALAKAAAEDWFKDEYTEEGCNWRGWYMTPTNDTSMQHVVVDGAKEFPKLFEQLYQHLPIKKVIHAKCWENQFPIGLHRDLDEQYPGVPTSLRVMLHDENPEPTFWLHPKPDASLGWGYERLTVDPTKESFLIDAYRETESNTFVFNNSEYCHAARKVPGYNKILMFLLVEWDWAGYENLMDKSL